MLKRWAFNTCVLNLRMYVTTSSTDGIYHNRIIKMLSLCRSASTWFCAHCRRCSSHLPWWLSALWKCGWYDGITSPACVGWIVHSHTHAMRWDGMGWDGKGCERLLWNKLSYQRSPSHPGAACVWIHHKKRSHRRSFYARIHGYPHVAWTVFTAM